MTMPGLPVTLRLSGRPVILVGTGAAAQAKRRLLERAGAHVIAETDAWTGTGSEPPRIALVAVDDDAEAEAAVRRLRARGMLVNAVDRPALSDFTIPALIDRTPVLIAVSTDGASAGLAAALRQRMEAWLPARLGALALALRDARGTLRARWPDGGARRRAITTALAPGGPLDPLREQDADAVSAWLSAPENTNASAAPRIARITLHSNDPDELSLRAARLLALADRVCHAPGVPDAILARARADAPRILLSGTGRETSFSKEISGKEGLTVFVERAG